MHPLAHAMLKTIRYMPPRTRAIVIGAIVLAVAIVSVTFVGLLPFFHRFNAEWIKAKRAWEKHNNQNIRMCVGRDDEDNETAERMNSVCDEIAADLGYGPFLNTVGVFYGRLSKNIDDRLAVLSWFVDPNTLWWVVMIVLVLAIYGLYRLTFGQTQVPMQPVIVMPQQQQQQPFGYMQQPPPGFYGQPQHASLPYMPDRVGELAFRRAARERSLTELLEK